MISKGEAQLPLLRLLLLVGSVLYLRDNNIALYYACSEPIVPLHRIQSKHCLLIRNVGDISDEGPCQDLPVCFDGVAIWGSLYAARST